MYSSTALAGSGRVRHVRRSESSICIEGQNDFIIALPSPSPTEPTEGMSPLGRIRSVKAQDVNPPSQTWTLWVPSPRNVCAAPVKR